MFTTARQWNGCRERIAKEEARDMVKAIGEFILIMTVWMTVLWVTYKLSAII